MVGWEETQLKKKLHSLSLPPCFLCVFRVGAILVIFMSFHKPTFFPWLDISCSHPALCPSSDTLPPNSISHWVGFFALAWVLNVPRKGDLLSLQSPGHPTSQEARASSRALSHLSFRGHTTLLEPNMPYFSHYDLGFSISVLPPPLPFLSLRSGSMGLLCLIATKLCQ